MAIRADVSGVAELQANLRRMEAQARNRLIREATHTAALDLQRAVVDNIRSGPATGRPRQRGGVSSAPGEYPMQDTGVLGAMIDVERTLNGADVVSRAEYSEKLEFKDPAKGGRPFMARSLQENEARIHAVVNWAAARLFGI
jgi:hypothetical protein